MSEFRDYLTESKKEKEFNKLVDNVEIYVEKCQDELNELLDGMDEKDPRRKKYEKYMDVLETQKYNFGPPATWIAKTLKALNF